MIPERTVRPAKTITIIDIRTVLFRKRLISRYFRIRLSAMNDNIAHIATAPVRIIIASVRKYLRVVVVEEPATLLLYRNFSL